MTEFLDVYDANRRHVGSADRNVVHAFGLWHKTVHCWIVLDDQNSKMVFQRRARTLKDNPGKLYTTASGHVSAGESVADAFKREISQEIGLDISTLDPRLLYETVWIGDIKRADGVPFNDRVFCNVFYAPYNGSLSDFKFTDGEVDGLVAIDLDQIIDFVRAKIDNVTGTEFDGENTTEVNLTKDDFVLVGNETVYDKFGRIAERIKSGIVQQ
ncbi:MAG: NUDIX domain-containing protein [Rickettsiales bacterium]|jgi:isopentenyldiphosphate isomerase|nr:NUDIX domain-containing protein [Rickettsiales bacterium]